MRSMNQFHSSRPAQFPSPPKRSKAMLLLIALVAPNEPGATHGPSTLQRLLQVRDMRGCTAVHWAAYKGDMPALQPGELSEEQHWRYMDGSINQPSWVVWRFNPLIGRIEKNSEVCTTYSSERYAR